MAVLLLLLSVARAAAPENAAPEDTAPTPAFGTDVSVGIAAGTLLGEWPDPGVHGIVGGRVDLFMVGRDTPGPRLGASAWGRGAVWPLQTHTDPSTDIATPFGITQYGLSAVLRFDPAIRWTGTFGFGFGRTDLRDYEGGVLGVPTFSIEAGVRQALGKAFVDYGAQSGWGSARGADGGWAEWWSVSAGVSLGFHAR